MAKSTPPPTSTPPREVVKVLGPARPVPMVEWGTERGQEARPGNR